MQIGLKLRQIILVAVDDLCKHWQESKPVPQFLSLQITRESPSIGQLLTIRETSTKCEYIMKQNSIFVFCGWFIKGMGFLTYLQREFSCITLSTQLHRYTLSLHHLVCFCIIHSQKRYRMVNFEEQPLALSWAPDFKNANSKLAGEEGGAIQKILE